ncbi:MAG: cobalt-precorrin-6A reductase [Beijerinckiaceae bacterium]|nr:cobalt-precorrin-6A reductase [Beijerinckiaceae bacterium]
MTNDDRRRRVLILGGTTEARLLSERLCVMPRFDVTLSLAGRTQQPLPLPVTVRSGGFGGAKGLADYVVANGVDRVIDATHPFAARIKANASSACAACAVPLLALIRAPWTKQPGDVWLTAAGGMEAVAVLGIEPRCVFLTIGRADLAAFEAAPQHRYLIRSVDAPDEALALPGAHFMRGRGPFSYAEEIELMRNYGIEVLVSKNSGGEATYAKIEAARRLNVPVVMIERPFVALAGPRTETHSIDEAVDWLAHDVAP